MEEINFEEAMKKLEQITAELEKGDLSLDESVKKFEEGIKLSKECNKILEDDFPVSPCPYPAGSASLKRAIFVRNCRTHGKMRAGWSGVLGYYTIIGFLIRRVCTKTLRIY